MGEQQKKTIEIFCCYAHKDKKLQHQLETHLKILENQGQPIKRYYREISASREWTQVIDPHIKTAHITLLLISPDFISTGYLHSKDMIVAFDRRDSGATYIIPVLLRPVDYKNTPVSPLQFLPHNNKPITKWTNRDDAFFDVSQGIKAVIEEIKSKHSDETTDLRNDPNPQESQDIILENDTGSFTNQPELNFSSNPSDRTFIETEAISPSMGRFSYPLNQTQKPPKKTKRRKRSSTNSVGYHQLILLNTDLDYEDLRNQAQSTLANNQPKEALNLLEDIDLRSAPSQQRWRLAALRGHCYFGLGKFLPAQQDYTYALGEKPKIVPTEQLLEETMLYLNSAESNRELGNLEEASEQYQAALAHMDRNTPVGYLAEAHWGLALVLFEQLHERVRAPTQLEKRREHLLQEALNHAEEARRLFNSSGEALNAASVTCDIALFEQIAGNLEKARTHLQDVLNTWTPMLYGNGIYTTENRKRMIEYNNVVSAASCYLAGIELETLNYKDALIKVKQAQKAGEHSYVLRHGESLMMLGRILETQYLQDPRAEEAFRKAIAILTHTDLLAARVRAHELLGRHLLKISQVDLGEKELDEARRLSHLAMFSHYK